MSDITKKKISEKCKKFSLCKLCSKQCRGFRGLVDHMHRDHEDYKPWRCHICHERTTFVKTLYRHLNQKHDTKSSPCHVCGKKFSRAQSMLLHVSQVRLLAYIYNWSIISWMYFSAWSWSRSSNRLQTNWRFKNWREKRFRYSSCWHLYKGRPFFVSVCGSRFLNWWNIIWKNVIRPRTFQWTSHLKTFW